MCILLKELGKTVRLGRFGKFAKECKKLKRAKDYVYHKEKMMLCKWEERGVLLSTDKGEWLQETDEELDE
ncbi:hypothetical protein Tco_1035894 [Tanacetum coccineum]